MNVQSPININPDLDFLQQFSNSFDNLQFDNPYLSVKIDGKFHEIEELLRIDNILECPVYLSINIQSLNSKFECFSNFIADLLSKQINVEVIAIQECWNIEYADLLQIPGYHPFIFKQREGVRGGGVGFYIKECISYEVIQDCSHFENKIFESLTLLLSHHFNFKIFVTSLYRSNGTLPNVSQNDQKHRFNLHFDGLLSKLSQKRQKSFIFLTQILIF
jgi:hypothetical protein